MAEREFTNIGEETFPNITQLYDLVEAAPGQRIKVVRVKGTRPYNVEENAMLTGDETDGLIKVLASCDELFPTKEINCVPDGIALDIDYGRRKYRNGEQPSLQKTLLDMDDFCEEEYGAKLNLVVYFSKDCWLSLHVLNVRKDNTKCRVFYRWPAIEKLQGCADLELTEELREVFVLAQKIIMNKARDGELRGIEVGIATGDC